ncbi:MAG: bifunctional adenosylcobinamide kinase/adenosylcobinamide-phosphate guanylyltransferase [Lachnospiraceae bacterium]|nr:bifunctional adenosylcobinamide kinase/adenosylcobinamide-phosphate guanylyltransferase [Lachnospiraceae bacterium]
MLFLLLGGSGSGKSAYAEELVKSLQHKESLYYVATMESDSAEAKDRIDKHRRLRDGKGFITLEYPIHVENAVKEIQSKENIMLLECVSNLVANTFFAEDDYWKQAELDEIAKKITGKIKNLSLNTKHLVAVSNNIFEDGIKYDESVIKYQKLLGRVNCLLAEDADVVVEIVCALPVVWKGTLPLANITQ